MSQEMSSVEEEENSVTEADGKGADSPKQLGSFTRESGMKGAKSQDFPRPFFVPESGFGVGNNISRQWKI
jgi:hypothetical protein